MQTVPVQVMEVGQPPSAAQAGRWHVEPPQTYGAGQGEVLLQVRIAQRPVVVQRSAPPQSASVVQSRTHAAKLPHVVPLGQSPSVPQPLQTPPGAVAVHVD